MVSEQKHEMQLVSTHPSGAEEWVCPECGRRFIAQWSPNFRRVILENGDERTIHTGQGTEIQAHISVHPKDETFPEHTELNDVWKQYLETLDIDLDEPDDDIER
jgi:hypothetical protein